MNNLEKISRLNEVFGNVPVTKLKSTEREQVIISQLALIVEEVEELSEAVADNDSAQMRDAIADILTVVYGFAYLAGVDANADLEIVTESNLSKLCTTPKELDDTVRYYKQGVGIAVEVSGTEGEMIVKSAYDQTGSDGKFYPKGKFLKCVAWHKPYFTSATGPTGTFY